MTQSTTERTEGRRGNSVPSTQIWPRSCNEERPMRRKVGKGREARHMERLETQVALPPSGRNKWGGDEWGAETLRQKQGRVQ